MVIPRNRTSLVSYSPLKEEEEEGTDKLARGQSEDDDDAAGLRASENRQVRLGAEGERIGASTYMMSTKYYDPLSPLWAKVLHYLSAHLGLS